MQIKDYTTLEQIIDRNSLASVLEAIQSICNEKANHINESYSDHRLAKAWEIAGRPLDKAIALANDI